MRIFRMALAVMLGALFVGLWSQLEAQGTIEPRDTDQPTFSNGSGAASTTSNANSSEMAAMGGSGQQVSVLRAVSGDVPPGFSLLNSGAIVMDDLKITIQMSGYPTVDGQLQAINQRVNQQLDEIRNKLNKIIVDQVDPTLQLKNPTMDNLGADDKLNDGVKEQAKDARDRIKKIMDQARMDATNAYNACPTFPLPEPAPCRAKMPGTLQSIETGRTYAEGQVNIWEQKNLNAIKNPQSFKPETATSTDVPDWNGAVQFIEGKKNEHEQDTGDAAQKVGGNLGDMQQRGIAEKQE